MSRPIGRLDRLPVCSLPGGLLLHEARSLLSRTRGLAGLDDLPDRAALLIPRCRSVHTFGMRFVIDVIFLDGDRRVVRVEPYVPPRRVVWARAARAVVETRAGEAERFLAAGIAGAA